MEEWRAVVGYKGLYECSDKGNVRSVDRRIVCKNGRKRHYKSVMLKPAKDEGGYRIVDLSKNGISKTTKVAILVAKAFPEICGTWFEGCEVDHIIPVMNGGTDEATNLRVCTPKQNSNNPLTKQNYSEAKKGEKNPNSKPVLQYSKDGSRLNNRWACIMEAARALGIKNSNISECCKGKRKSAGGYVWKYKEAGN